MTIDIRVISADESKAAVDILTEGLNGEPMFTTIYRDSGQRLRAVSVVMQEFVDSAIPARTAWGYYEDDDLVGVAIWAAPGTYPARGREQLEDVPLLLRLLRINPKAAIAMSKAEFNTQHYFPTTRVWYLRALGVSPLAQGKGVGGRLIEGMLRRADDNRDTCYLETATVAHVRFFERLGFHIVEPAAQIIPEGPTHTTMLRRPQPIERVRF